jgi:PHS family inorganic phosphate transporter-like MFS transporter
VFDYLYTLCRGNIILAIAGLIPGSYACFFFIDSWGRKPIQLMGFCILTILFATMGFAHDRLSSTTNGGSTTPGSITTPGTSFYVALYCLSNFFSNFGPNTTTFVIPGEAFPTRYRATAHGISAASGKLGAIIAQVGFARLKDLGGPDAFVKHM